MADKPKWMAKLYDEFAKYPRYRDELIMDPVAVNMAIDDAWFRAEIEKADHKIGVAAFDDMPRNIRHEALKQLRYRPGDHVEVQRFISNDTWEEDIRIRNHRTSEHIQFPLRLLHKEIERERVRTAMYVPNPNAQQATPAQLLQDMRALIEDTTGVPSDAQRRQYLQNKLMGLVANVPQTPDPIPEPKRFVDMILIIAGTYEEAHEYVTSQLGVPRHAWHYVRDYKDMAKFGSCSVHIVGSARARDDFEAIAGLFRIYHHQVLDLEADEGVEE